MRKLGVDEWIVKLEGMYENVRSCVWVCKGLSDELEVKFGVHQGSVLSPLLFIIVLNALSREIRGSQLAAPVAEWVRSLYFSALNHSIISPLCLV